MAFTKITTTNIAPNTVAGYAEFAGFATSLAPKVTTVNVANSLFSVVDDTAVNIGGGYVVVTGANFQSGATVLIDTTPASSVTYVDSTTLRVQVPGKSAATYNLYVVNPDGGTGIRVSGVTYSGTPTWVTTSPLDNQSNNVSFNLNFSATSATSYAVANGSTLPAGTSLLANGYFYGTVTIGSETVYSFDVVATDAENQDSPKTFGLTVTVPIPRLLYAIGDLSYGATAGYNNTHYGTFLSPVELTSSTDWSEVIISDNSVFGVKQDGTLWAWGKNGTGQLGLNFLSSEAAAPYGVSSPTQVGSDTNWYKCFANGIPGTRNVFALKTDGTLWAWGNNGYNGASNLGLGVMYVRRSSPVQIGTDTNWSDVLAVRNATLAIKTDGTLWAWGLNSYGISGLNASTQAIVSSPTQVGALTNWSKFLTSSGADTNNGRATRAIKTNGTLWTIGGFGGVINQSWFSTISSSPVQYGTDTDWASGSVNDSASAIAIKTNGTMWALGGSGGDGELGLNSTVARSSPVQIGTGTNWSKVFGSRTSYHAIKTDGTLWAWGSNYDYLGDGSSYGANHKSSPIQIGSLTGWASVNSSGNRGLILRDQP